VYGYCVDIGDTVYFCNHAQKIFTIAKSSWTLACLNGDGSRGGGGG
jgi:hypothetical protein